MGTATFGLIDGPGLHLSYNQLEKTNKTKKFSPPANNQFSPVTKGELECGWVLSSLPSYTHLSMPPS